MRLKSILGNIALVILSLVVSFAIGEFVVRLLYKDQTVLFPRYHTDYQYGRYTIRGIRPNAEFWHTSVDGTWKFVTNSKGFRNAKEFDYRKPAGTLRVLTLGDSCTQGHEVRQDQTFSAVLERSLNFHKSPAEVINTGVSGFGNDEELVLLENEGFKYNPDVVVVGFFGNDYEDNVKSGLFGLDEQRHLVEKKYEHIPGVKIQNFIYSIPSVQWLSENSYFYSLLFNKTWTYFKYMLSVRAAQQINEGNNISAPAHNGFEFAVPTSATHSDYEIDLASALIERIQRFCTSKGIRLIVVDMPTMLGPYQFASSISPELRAKLDAAHIEYISSETLLQKFNGVAEMHVLHGYNHPSEFTNTLIGEELNRRILSTSVKTTR
ncbi:MAG: hypothetical protein WAW02_00695 [Sideroxyarcus sp.]